MNPNITKSDEELRALGLGRGYKHSPPYEILVCTRCGLEVQTEVTHPAEACIEELGRRLREVERILEDHHL